MTATFACPHCGASYPVKPVLVGRAVRCTTCKNPFKLRDDGIADKVIDPPPAAPPAPAATVPPPVVAKPPVVTPPSAAKPPAAPTPVNGAHVVATSPAPAERPATGRIPRTDRLSKHQEDARKAMAASLSNAASAALTAETVKREVEAEKKAERRKQAAKPGPATGPEGRVGEIGPVVLTGTGTREHRDRLMSLLIAIGVVGLLCGAVFVFSLKSPQRRALIHYASVVEGERTRYPDRIPAITERAWITGVPALTDLGKMSLGSTRTIPFLAVRPIFAKHLAGSVYLPAYRVWAQPERAPEVDKLWSTRKDLAGNLAFLRERKIPVVDHKVVAKELEDAGWTSDDVDLLLQLIQAQTDRNGANWIAKQMLSGDLPDAIEVTNFGGTGGSLLIDLGRVYKTRTVNYTGRLLHFVGANWPKEWKVLEIKTASSN